MRHVDDQPMPRGGLHVHRSLGLRTAIIVCVFDDEILLGEAASGRDSVELEVTKLSKRTRHDK